ncbi:MAG: hypothetical protein ACI4Q8_07425 [Ruminococcus sp.]
MPTLYLHIGMPKTGTSYIQSTLKLNGKVLKDKGYVYPLNLSAGNYSATRNAHFLIQKIVDKNGKRDVNKEKEIWNKYFDRISKLFKTYDNVILSEEGIWNLGEKRDKKFWKKLKKELDERGIDCKIIVYLRRQDLFIQSHWAQKVREYETRSFKEYIHGKNILRLNYYSRLKVIADVMGKESIDVRLYEKQQWGGTKNNLISDFFDAIGLEFNEDFQELSKTTSNISLGGVYLDYKRYMNKYPESKTTNGKKSNLHKVLTKLMYENASDFSFSKNNLLTYNDTMEILDKYKDENELVAREFLNRADGVLFKDEVPKDDASQKTDYTVDDYFNVSCDVVCMLSNDIDALESKMNEQKREIAKLNKTIKSQQGTIDWVTTSFPKKVVRKLKSIFKIK